MQCTGTTVENRVRKRPVQARGSSSSWKKGRLLCDENGQHAKTCHHECQSRRGSRGASPIPSQSCNQDLHSRLVNLNYNPAWSSSSVQTSISWNNAWLFVHELEVVLQNIMPSLQLVELSSNSFS